MGKPEKKSLKLRMKAQVGAVPAPVCLCRYMCMRVKGRPQHRLCGARRELLAMEICCELVRRFLDDKEGTDGSSLCGSRSNCEFFNFRPQTHITR